VKKGLLGILSIITLIALILGSVACSSKVQTQTQTSNSTTTSVQTSASASTQDLNVACLAYLTGGAAPWGIAAQKGLLLWADDINAAGGLKVGSTNYMIRVKSWDTGSTVATGLQAAKEIILNEGYKYIFGCSAEGDTTRAMAQLVTENKVLQISHCSDEYGSFPGDPYQFDNWLCNPTYPQVGFMALHEFYPNVKKIAAISMDDAVGRITHVYVLKSIKDYNLDLTYQATLDMNTTDFSPIVAAAVASKPDMVYMIVPPGIQAQILDAFRSGGYTGHFLTDGHDMNLMAQKNLTSYVEGDILIVPTSWDVPGMPQAAADW